MSRLASTHHCALRVSSEPPRVVIIWWYTCPGRVKDRRAFAYTCSTVGADAAPAVSDATANADNASTKTRTGTPPRLTISSSALTDYRREPVTLSRSARGRQLDAGPRTLDVSRPA